MSKRTYVKLTNNKFGGYTLAPTALSSSATNVDLCESACDSVGSNCAGYNFKKDQYGNTSCDLVNKLNNMTFDIYTNLGYVDSMYDPMAMIIGADTMPTSARETTIRCKSGYPTDMVLNISPPDSTGKKYISGIGTKCGSSKGGSTNNQYIDPNNIFYQSSGGVYGNINNIQTVPSSGNMGFKSVSVASDGSKITGLLFKDKTGNTTGYGSNGPYNYSYQCPPDYSIAQINTTLDGNSVYRIKSVDCAPDDSLVGGWLSMINPTTIWPFN